MSSRRWGTGGGGDGESEEWKMTCGVVGDICYFPYVRYVTLAGGLTVANWPPEMCFCTFLVPHMSREAALKGHPVASSSERWMVGD